MNHPLPNQRTYTLVLIKPDAFARGIVGEVLSNFETQGFWIHHMVMHNPCPPRILAEHYQEHKDKPFYQGLIRFMATGPLLALVLYRHSALLPPAWEVARTIAGPTDGSGRHTVRGRYGVDLPATLVHVSDGSDSAARELQLWFPGEL